MGTVTIEIDYLEQNVHVGLQFFYARAMYRECKFI